MLTSTLQNGTAIFYNKWLLPCFLIFLCCEGISSTNTTIDQSCANGLTIVLSWRNSTPYVFQQNNRVQGILVEILQRAFHTCCNAKVQLQFNNIEGVEMNLTNQSIDHGMIPVSRTSYQSLTAYGRPFVGLVDSPGIAVITQSSVPGADLLMAILDSWPILIFIITTISLSGVVIWVLVSSSSQWQIKSPTFILYEGEGRRKKGEAWRRKEGHLNVSLFVIIVNNSMHIVTKSFVMKLSRLRLYDNRESYEFWHIFRHKQYKKWYAEKIRKFIRPWIFCENTKLLE